MDKQEAKAKRLAFAKEAAMRVRAATWAAWLTEAKTAKALGLYSPKTYFFDIAGALESMAKEAENG